MHSYRHFVPSGNKNTARIIKYVAEMNYQNNDNKTCVCIPEKFNKNIPSSDTPSFQVSNNIRIAQIIKSAKGGKPQFVNPNLGNITVPPPLNRFN